MARQYRVIDPAASQAIIDQAARSAQGLEVSRPLLRTGQQRMPSGAEHHPFVEPVDPVPGHVPILRRVLESFDQPLRLVDLRIGILVEARVARAANGQVYIANGRLFSHQASEEPDPVDAGNRLWIGIEQVYAGQQIVQHRSRFCQRRAHSYFDTRNRHSLLGHLVGDRIDQPTVDTLFIHDRAVPSVREDALEIDEAGGIPGPKIGAQCLFEDRWAVPCDPDRPVKTNAHRDPVAARAGSGPLRS